MSDDGDSLASEGDTCQTCGSSLKLPIDRFKDDLYLNWIKASLCLQLTKEGLEEFIEDTTIEVHKDLLKHIVSAKLCPNKCRPVHYNNVSYKCKSNICDALRLALLHNSTSGFLSLNSASLASMETNPAEIAKLYMPSICKNYTGPKDGDCTAILAFMGGCLRCLSNLQNQGHIDEVRNSRNAIMHSGTMRITEKEFKQHTDGFIKLLTDPKHLLKDPNCKDAVTKIEQIVNHKMHVDLVASEKIVLDRHEIHIKSELDALRSELETDTCSASELHEMKLNVRMIADSELKRQAVMELYGLETTNTEHTRKIAISLQERVEEFIKQKDVDEKTLEVRTNLESKQSSEEIKQLRNDMSQLNDTVKFLVNQGLSKELHLLSGRQKHFEEKQQNHVKDIARLEARLSEFDKAIREHTENKAIHTNVPNAEVDSWKMSINQTLEDLKQQIVELREKTEAEKSINGPATRGNPDATVKQHTQLDNDTGSNSLYEMPEDFGDRSATTKSLESTVSDMEVKFNRLSAELSIALKACTEMTLAGTETDKKINKLSKDVLRLKRLQLSPTKQQGSEDKMALQEMGPRLKKSETAEPTEERLYDTVAEITEACKERKTHGWLWKHTVGMTWHRVLLKIESDTLSYKKQHDVFSKVVRIQDIQAKEVDDMEGRSYCIEISNMNSTYRSAFIEDGQGEVVDRVSFLAEVFSADNEKDRQDWIDSINFAADDAFMKIATIETKQP